MCKALYIFLALLLLGASFVILESATPSGGFGAEDFDIMASAKDVIIIFNSGGWGNARLEDADDFAPILAGIQSTLEQWGLESVVLPYARTRSDLLGRVAGLREIVDSYHASSRYLADKVDSLISKYPDKYIILAGLSNGGAFTERTMERIGQRPKTLAVVAGVPFWNRNQDSSNILRLDNDASDSLSDGRIVQVLFAAVEAPFKWLCAKLSDGKLSLARAMEIPGHQYPWNSEYVGPEIVDFLRQQIRIPDVA